MTWITKEIPFYFDFLSPYSFFSWKNLKKLKSEHDLTIRPIPVLLAGILNHWGQKGPAEIEPKRNALFRECLRMAADMGIEFTAPKHHPFNPLYALRLALHDVSGEHQEAVIDSLWELGWQRGQDLGDPDIIESFLTEKGFPAADLMEKSFEREIKKQLKQNTAMAIEKGVFGVPSFEIEKEIFWGNHSLDTILKKMQGLDNLDWEKYEELKKKVTAAASQSLKV